jgi:hypothetical protein
MMEASELEMPLVIVFQRLPDEEATLVLMILAEV